MGIDTILIILGAIVYFLLAIIFHEVGHIISYYYLTKIRLSLYYKPPFSLKVGKPSDYILMWYKHYKIMLMWGIIAGFLPLLMFQNLVGSYISNYWFFVMYVSYTVGCWKDIKGMFQND